MAVMHRRRFLKAATTGLLLSPAGAGRLLANAQSGYSGRCVVSLQLEGGADVTQFCDPKTNTPGEKKINNWADFGEPRQTGNIVYAPVANNQWLFDRYGLDTLIVNGVDAQTNSHNTGQLFNATGSNSEGKPSLTALHAAMNAPEEALSYSVFGGVSRTAGLTNYSLFDNVNQLRTLADPRKSQRQEFEGKRRKVEFDFVDAIHTAEALDPQGDASMSPRRKASLERFRNARATRPDLAALT